MARWARFLVKHKDRLLSSQLIGNNVCNIGASLTFALLFDRLDDMVLWDLSRIPSPESWLLTPVIVVFGEMLPKSLFRIYPFQLTMSMVPILMAVYLVTLPFTCTFSMLAGLINRFKQHNGVSFMTKVREEMVLIALEGSKSGTLFKSADVFIQNVLTLHDKKVSDLVSAGKDALPSIRFFSNELVADILPRLPEAPGILVFHPDGNAICGTVSLLDIIDAPPDATVGSLCKFLPVIKAGQSLVSTLRSTGDDSYFYSIEGDNKKKVGIIDTFTFLQAAINNPKEMYAVE